ncbi:hypothetical protein [Polyangium mundeleinium]|uniref:Transmembrane protein n=1 Tax=Polyangium mundeleinium TaxID=2995306 RepID=A0ABT5F4S4_9BACT|nr:hypothetical protein [Polyangium mundeleinium]MDC0748091.1 hypothetical protein [Polyangium mundeleinium]
MDISPALPSVKSLVPVLCHGFSLAAHVLFLGGAALLGPLHSADAPSIEHHLPRAQTLLLVTAVPGETVTEERGGEREVSGRYDEGTVGPLRNDAERAVPPGERAEAYKVDHPDGNDVPAAMFYPALDPSTVPSNWFNGMGNGSGGTRDKKVDRGDRIEPETPAQRRAHGEAEATSPAGGPPKTRVCPPSRSADIAVFCRATSAAKR